MKKKKFSKKDVSNIIIDKKSKFNKKSILLALVGIGIISIMVGSALNLWSVSDKEKYGDYKFVKEEGLDGRWRSYIGEKFYYFDFLPQELEAFTNVNFNLNSKEITLLFDPEDMETVNRVTDFKAMFEDFGRFPFPACIKEENCGDIPVLNCDEVVYGIYFVNSNNNKIYEDGNCFVIDGDYEYNLKSINYLKYKLLGIL